MKLHNTLSRQKEELSTQEPGVVKLYTCGPTVYQEPHIGNWRTFIFYDLLVRTLKMNGLTIHNVLNITDVGHLVSDADEGEDKLHLQAKREHNTAWKLAEHYTHKFTSGMKQLNILPAWQMPKATDHIAEQIELVKQLESKGYTYKIDDGVYFDTSKLKDYGKLAGINLEQQRTGARVEPNPQKRAPVDFALWKLSAIGQQRDMEWDSPWGKGFPGWHLECSAMALKYLGETLDIHAGGVDHIGVHHSNEIAQSETATDKPLANLWLHTQFLLVEGHKMSKSLGNVYLLADIAAKSDPIAFKLLVLMSHYRSQQNFTWDALAAAASHLKRLRAWADLLHQATDSERNFSKQLEIAEQQMRSALDDDLNSPKALAALSDLVDQMDHLPSQNLSQFKEVLAYTQQALGIVLEGEAISAEQAKLIRDREAARASKDFANSDQLRQQLHQAGLAIEDTAHGPRWSRL
jgi:cysteinyl-tRNA synthetase